MEKIRNLGGLVAIIVYQGTLDHIGAWRELGATRHTTHLREHLRHGSAGLRLRCPVSKVQGVPVAFGKNLNGLAGLPGSRHGPEQ